jgi:hypothetical protein
LLKSDSFSLKGEVVTLEEKLKDLEAQDIWPLIKTCGLDIQCWPDEKTPSLMRLRITLGVNSDEKTQEIIDQLIDPVPGNGVVCQWNNLTWIIGRSEEITALKAQLALAIEALTEVSKIKYGIAANDIARAALKALEGEK